MGEKIKMEGECMNCPCHSAYVESTQPTTKVKEILDAIYELSDAEFFRVVEGIGYINEMKEGVAILNGTNDLLIDLEFKLESCY